MTLGTCMKGVHTYIQSIATDGQTDLELQRALQRDGLAVALAQEEDVLLVLQPLRQLLALCVVGE